MLTLHTFGSVFVERDGAALSGAAGQRRVLALLALLATAREGGVSRDRLLGLLWPEAGDDRARHSLTQALYNARRALGADDLFITAGDIRLNRDCLASDVGTFVAAIERADHAATVKAYGGPFLDGLYVTGAAEFDQWVTLQRARFAADAARALDRLALMAESRGETEVVIDLRRRRAALDPLDSGAVLALMTAQTNGGDVAGAIRQARVHEALLRQQFDLAPDPAITSLAARLLTAPARPTPALVGVDAGVLPEAAESEAPIVPPPVPASAPTEFDDPPTSWRRRVHARRWVGAAATFVVALTAGVFLTVIRDRPVATAAAAAPLGVSTTMVAPFRVAGADPSLAYLRDGMVELLSSRLADYSEGNAVDPDVVLSQWRSAGLSDAVAPYGAAATRVAERLGAHRLITGSVVGSAPNLLITASIIEVRDGTARATETVKGPADSLSALVDQLVVRLLAADAGEGERLGPDKAPPLASIKSYLSGQEAYRQGRFAEAVESYERALDIDSTFALAAFRLAMAADRLNAGEQHDWALSIAWMHRGSLNRRDQAHLVAFAGPRYPAPSSEAEQLAAWERATVLVPDRAEVWQELGERFFYDGPVMGMTDWRRRATAAFRRALVLDPNASMARGHLILSAARMRDTVVLSDLASSRALADSVGKLTRFLTWRVALARNDMAALRSNRESFSETDDANLRWVAMSSLFDAIGVDDGERALRIRRTRARRATDELDALLAQHSFALNQGRPVLALDVTEQLQEVQPGTHAHLRLRVLDALYGDGGREAAARAASELAAFGATPTTVGSQSGAVQLADLCVLEQWRLAHGDASATRSVVARLRTAAPLVVTLPVATPPIVCAEILRATQAVVTRVPNALAKVQQLDSLMLTGPAVSDAASYAHIAVARLYERLGARQAALEAIRRRGYMSGWPRYLASARRDEGRLALAVGDTAAASDVYRRYLTLRDDAEGSAKRDDEAIRRFLQRE